MLCKFHYKNYGKTVQNEAHFNYVIKKIHFSDIATPPLTAPGMKTQ